MHAEGAGLRLGFLGDDVFVLAQIGGRLGQRRDGLLARRRRDFRPALLLRIVLE